MPLQHKMDLDDEGEDWEDEEEHIAQEIARPNNSRRNNHDSLAELDHL